MAEAGMEIGDLLRCPERQGGLAIGRKACRSGIGQQKIGQRIRISGLSSVAVIIMDMVSKPGQDAAGQQTAQRLQIAEVIPFRVPCRVKTDNMGCLLYTSDAADD